MGYFMFAHGFVIGLFGRPGFVVPFAWAYFVIQWHGLLMVLKYDVVVLSGCQLSRLLC